MSKALPFNVNAIRNNPDQFREIEVKALVESPLYFNDIERALIDKGLTVGNSTDFLLISSYFDTEDAILHQNGVTLDTVS